MGKPTMKVWHDWEFEERCGFVDVISAGFVREDGQELYIVFDDFNTLSVARNPWLMDNVMSAIGHEEITSHVTGTGQPVKDLLITDPARLSKRLARHRILQFVEDIRPEWWAWYGAYDHVALCSLFGTMVDLPAEWPMLTMDLKQMHKAAGYPQMPKQPQGLHNALEDARFNVERHKFLTQYLKGRTYIVARSAVRAMDWVHMNGLEKDDYRIIKDAEMFRGLSLSKTRDRIIYLDAPGEEMIRNVELAMRLP